MWNDIWTGVLGDGFVLEYDQHPTDADEAGIPNGEDSCPNSNTQPTIVIGQIDTGVPNIILERGCSISDRIAQLMSGVNKGPSSVKIAKLVDSLKKSGVITAKQAAAITSAAARSEL